MVTSEVLKRVYFINTVVTSGSSIAVKINGRGYLVTAKHLFKGIEDESVVDIRVSHKNDWEHISGRLLLHRNEEIDLAVVDLDTNDFEDNGFLVDENDSYFLSQDVYFLGYPFGFKLEDFAGIQMNRGFPLPFVKKALISSFTLDPEEKIIFLDGHNNKGFSGGPVVSYIADGSGNVKMQIIAIVSGYVPEYDYITTETGSLEYMKNSGLVITYSIKHAFDILRLHRIIPL